MHNEKEFLKTENSFLTKNSVGLDIKNSFLIIYAWSVWHETRVVKCETWTVTAIVKKQLETFKRVLSKNDENFIGR